MPNEDSKTKYIDQINNEITIEPEQISPQKKLKSHEFSITLESSSGVTIEAQPKGI